MPLFLVVNYGNITKIILFTLLSGTVLKVNAGEKTDFLVNDDGGLAAQNNPRIAVAGDLSFVITWVDRREGTSDIYLQRFDSDGSPIESNYKINDDTNSSYQFEPAIAVDLSGLYTVVWKDYRNNNYPFGPDIYYQRFDSSVLMVGQNINLTTEYPDSTKESPDIALAEWGGVVVVWADYRNKNWDIYGQIISSNGSLIGANFIVNDDIGSNQQHAPRVAMSGQGWFVVTWYDNRMGNDDIFIQRFDSLGNKLGVNIKVNTDTDDARQAFPDIATDGAGHFTVVWIDWRNGIYPDNPDIYSKKYDTTMTPVSAEININTDSTQNAQREPCIAADRLGNVAIIWADSILSSWDIAGQMIDVDGVVREENFRANSFTDSLQYHPDVALDGKYRYITWEDNRNGNFDIYAAIQKYNDPSLSISPSSMNFEMLEGGQIPVSQAVVVEHFGYNPLPFTITANVDWLTVTPSSSITPDTISVTINTDTLATGIYFAILTFIDTYNNDSSVVMSIRLDVYSPIMSLSADTLYYTAFLGIDEVYVNQVVVENIGDGQFTWDATETADWISLSTYNGIDGDTVDIEIAPLNLVAGTYIESVIFESTDATGSPDTVYVSLNVVDNMPYIELQPDSIFAYIYELSSLDTFMIVNNPGTGILNWTANISTTWLQLDKSSGLSGDTIHISIADYTLSYGSYNAMLEVTDSAAFNISAQLPVIMEYFERSNDTIMVEPVLVESLQSTSTSITANLFNNVTKIFLPLKYDTTALSVDSVRLGLNLPDSLNYNAIVDSINGLVTIEWDFIQPDTFFEPGIYHLGELYISARDIATTTYIDTVNSDSLSPYIITGNKSVAPVFISGEITISQTTDVIENQTQNIPLTYTLKQNIPNPFNLSTLIIYELPTSTKVKLEIFNILGQRVTTLVSKTEPAGSYAVSWNGRVDNKDVAPSGIYFYRLKTGDLSLVRKMVLIK